MDNKEQTTQAVPGNTDHLSKNAESLSKEISWFAKTVNAKLDAYFQTAPVQQYDLAVLAKDIEMPEQESSKWFTWITGAKHHSAKGKVQVLEEDPQPSVIITPQQNIPQDISTPDLTNDHSVYADFVNYYKLSKDERFILMLAFIPHLQPHLLDVFFSVNKKDEVFL